MRILRNILATALLIIFTLISFVGMMVFMPSFSGRLTRINATGRKIMEAWEAAPPGTHTNNLFWLWLALFFGCLLTFLMSYAARRRRARIEVQMGDGRVVVLESAIKKYIRTALGDIPDVTNKRVDLRQSRQGLEASIYAQVRTHEKLPDLERQIIRRVRQALSDELGITSVAAVHVYIKDFEVRQRPVAPIEPPQPAPPAVAERPELPPLAAPAPIPAPVERPVWRPAPPAESPSTAPAAPPAPASPFGEFEDFQAAPAFEATPLPEDKPTGEASPSAAASSLEETTTPAEAPVPQKAGFFARWRRRPDAAPQAGTESQEPPNVVPDEVATPETTALEPTSDEMVTPEEKTEEDKQV